MILPGGKHETAWATCAESLRPNSTRSISCGFVAQQAVQQIHNLICNKSVTKIRKPYNKCVTFHIPFTACCRPIQQIHNKSATNPTNGVWLLTRNQLTWSWRVINDVDQHCLSPEICRGCIVVATDPCDTAWRFHVRVPVAYPGFHFGV